MPQFIGIDELRREFIQELARTQGTQLRVFVGHIAKDLEDPTTRNVPESFWQRVQQDYERVIRKHVKRIYETSARTHGMSKTDAVRRADGYAAVRAASTSVSMASNAFARSASLDERLLAETRRGTDFKYSDIAALATTVFSPERGRSVAINETTTAASTGSQDAMREQGLVSPDDEWINNPSLSHTGPCPICKPLHKTKRRVWQAKFPNGPPAHVNCVCHVKYANIRAARTRSRLLASVGE